MPFCQALSFWTSFRHVGCDALCLLINMLTRLLAVRYLPEWFPGATFHRTAAKSRQLVKEMRELPFNVVKERIVGVFT